MPNLDDIHYKFFQNLKLLQWVKTNLFCLGIEILVALVGLTIAWLFLQAKVKQV